MEKHNILEIIHCPCKAEEPGWNDILVDEQKKQLE